MKFIASTSILLKNLTLINGVISTNTVLPILEDFLFEVEPGKLTISATDLETSMSTAMDIDASETGKIAIPARILMDTLKNLPEQPLTFTIDDGTNGVEITSENGKYRLAGENGEDFPKIPIAEEVEEVELPTDTLSKAINHCLFAVSNDELRPAMTGVFFELGTDGINFIATDAHKLVRYRRMDATVESNASFIVPKKALNLLKNALSNDARVKISHNNANAFFSFGEVQLICRLVDARYPDYNAVIPKENPNQLTIDRKTWLGALKRIAIYANKTTYQVILKITGSELQISAQDLDFSNEANERLACVYDGDDLEIGFNARFLIEMLNVLDTDEVNVELSQANRAGLIIPAEKEDNEDILMLIMPVMLNT